MGDTFHKSVWSIQLLLTQRTRGNESFCLNKAFSLVIIHSSPSYSGPDSPRAREDPVRIPSPPPPPPLPATVRNLEEVMLSHQRADTQHSLDGEETDNRAASKSPCVTPESAGSRSAHWAGWNKNIVLLLHANTHRQADRWFSAGRKSTEFIKKTDTLRYLAQHGGLQKVVQHIMNADVLVSEFSLTCILS